MLLGDAGTLRRRLRGRPRAPSASGPRVPPPVRGRAIQQFGRLVEENKEALAALVTREVGKPYPESLGEVQEVIDTANFFLGEGRRLYGQTVPSEMPDKQLFTFRVPVGVAAVITAGNFPTAVPAWYLVPALLCGNAVVWKPAEYSRGDRRGARPAVPARGLPRRRLQPRAHRRQGDLRGPRAGARPRPGRQGRLHRLERGRRRDRRADRAPSAVGDARARRQEPDGRHRRRRPRPRRRGRAVQRLRHRRPALHVAGHGDRRRAASTTSSSRASSRPPRRPPSATRPRTSSTAR